MADETTTPASEPMTNRDDREAHLARALPAQVTEQPDPMLQMSTGRMGAAGITLVAIVIAVILGVAFYGLNSRTSSEPTAATPSTAHSAQPQAGGQPGPAATSAPRANASGVKG
jgi:hypothetical protein